MIKLLTGRPGCGKSYRAVHDYMIEKDKYYLFHNIDELKSDQIDEGKYIRDFEHLEGITVEQFFTREKQEELSTEIAEKYHRNMLIIIDEAQDYLDRFNPKVRAWLAYHRHLDQDIWLLTHNKFNIAREYNNLVEVEIQGQRGFVFSSFIYSYFEKGERVKTDRLKKDKKIFGLYKSFNQGEAKKPKSKLFMFMIVMGLTSVCIGGYWLFFQMPKLFTDYDKKTAKTFKMGAQNTKGASQDSSGSTINLNPLYSYVGIIKGKVLYSDQQGSLWFGESLNDDRISVLDKENLKVLAIDPVKGGKRLFLGSINVNSQGSNPKSSGPALGLRKIIVDIR
jgi:zona occludens toxin (predicted ATPase)